MGSVKHSSAFFDAILRLLCPSLLIQVPKYLHWFLKELPLATKKLICAHALFRLTTITSVFLLFNPYPFLLLSSSVMSNNCGKSSLFSAINTASSAYLMLLTLCPPILIPGYPSMLLKSFHCRERKGLEQAHILVRHRTLLFFFVLMSWFTHQLTLLLSDIISCFIFNWSCPWTSHRLAEGKIPSFLFLRVCSELPPNISHAFLPLIWANIINLS